MRISVTGSRTMRFVIYGAGGIGGVLGGRLAQHGHEVALIARGEHAAVTRERGLRVESPDAEVTISLETVTSPQEIAWNDGDVVLLAMKSQDTFAALHELVPLVPSDTPVVCVQN